MFFISGQKDRCLRTETLEQWTRQTKVHGPTFG